MKRSPEQQVDQSAKFAFSFFVASAGLWLLAAALLAYIAAAKLTNPLFLASWEVFTYGKIKISQANAFVYGWGGNSIFAVSLWIIARLSQSPVRGSIFSSFLPELCGISPLPSDYLEYLDGHMLGHELLEMPKEVWPALFHFLPCYLFSHFCYFQEP